jgi:hypothetical protein
LSAVVKKAKNFIIIDDSEEEEKIRDVRLKYGKFIGKLKQAEKGKKPIQILKKI